MVDLFYPYHIDKVNEKSSSLKRIAALFYDCVMDYLVLMR